MSLVNVIGANMHKSFVVLLSLAFATICGLGLSQAASKDAAPSTVESPSTGPTPYPGNANDWPGKGAIRVFGWMTENRKAFWSERSRKQGSVVFAGDSLIGGWASLAKDMAQWPVANRGIGGETTRGLLFRFSEDVTDLHPKAIILLSGSNDLSAQQDPRQSLANLSEMIKIAAKSSPGVPVVICTVPPRGNPQSPVDPQRVLELNRLIASLADSPRQVFVFDLYAALANSDGSQNLDYFASDRLHLSSAGYLRFREGLEPLLKTLNIG